MEITYTSRIYKLIDGNHLYITYISEIKPPTQRSVSELGDMKVYACGLY